jgi:hypothetical protein
MSRSYRHTPICAWASASTQKLFKSLSNRAFRHKVNRLCHTHQFDKLPHWREYGNEWDSPRDGKQWFGDLLSERSKQQWALSKYWSYGPKQEYHKLIRK